MNFEPGQTVIVLDSEKKRAGTGTVLCSIGSGLYKIAFTQNGGDKVEELFFTEHRLLFDKNGFDGQQQVSFEL